MPRGLQPLASSQPPTFVFHSTTSKVVEIPENKSKKKSKYKSKSRSKSESKSKK